MSNVFTDATGGQNALAYINSILDTYGLANLSGWAWDQIQSGHTDVEIAQLMTQTPEYKARFPAIALRQAAGLPAISPGEYVSYENQAIQLMHGAGMPATFYDSPGAFTGLIAGDVSLSELSSRVQKGFQAVQDADPAIQQAFRTYFGAQGPAALASYFLDPNTAAPVLEQQVAAAQAGGVGSEMGFNVDKGIAMQMAQAGVSEASARSGFDTLNAERSLFTQTAGEASSRANPVSATQGIQAQFGLSGAAATALKQEADTRQAAAAGGGGAHLTQKGFEGLGDQEAS